MIIFYILLFYISTILLSAIFVNNPNGFFGFTFLIGNLFLSLAVLLTIQLFYSEGGSFLDFDSYDSYLYDSIGKKGSTKLSYIIEWVKNTKFEYDDIGGTILPMTSYYFFDNYIFSRILNVLLHSITIFLILKLSDTPRSRLFVLFIFYNPILIYLISSGLKETFMCFLLILALYFYEKKKYIALQLSVISLLLFRYILVFKLFILNVYRYKKIVLFATIAIIVSSIILKPNLDIGDSGYLTFLIYSFNNINFITDRVPITANIALLTGPFPILSNLNLIYNQYWIVGLFFFNILTLNYWITLFNRKKNIFDFIIILSIIIILITGTTWKLRYWIPIFYIIIFQHQKLRLKFVNKTYLFYILIIISANFINA